jgi:sigma-B regulation protein RsbU (phosphoserine phosphatase)
MDPSHLSLLKKNKLFKGLSETHVEKLARHLKLERFAVGDIIVQENQIGDRVYLMVEGSARVQKRISRVGPESAQIGAVEAGDFFGEMSFFVDESERSATVCALTPAVTYSLHKDDFTKVLVDFPEVMRNILSNIVLHLVASNALFIEQLSKEKEALEAKVVERTVELANISMRLDRELAVAQNIQRNLLPEKKMKFPGVSVRTEYLPAEELSGDIIGVFLIDEKRIGVYGGDVCGHGIYAAVIMSYVKKLIETSVKRVLIRQKLVVKPPGAVLTSINQSFIAEISQGDPEIYLSLFLGVLDLGTLEFEYASAGIHVPPFIHSQGKIEELFPFSDFPIGHVRDNEYGTSRKTFSRGDSLLFVSDGVVEARSGPEVYGAARLKAEALPVLSKPGELDLDAIVDSVTGFIGGRKPDDDMCFLLLRLE